MLVGHANEPEAQRPATSHVGWLRGSVQHNRYCFNRGFRRSAIHQPGSVEMVPLFDGDGTVDLVFPPSVSADLGNC